jgi:hypothetical protein
MANPSRLNLLPYLQSWDGTSLRLRLLSVPYSSPVDSLIPEAFPPSLSFAAAQLVFDVRLVQGLDQLPSTASTATSVIVPTLAPGTALYAELATVFKIDPAPPLGNPRPPGTLIKKYLPPTYRNAVGFVGPRSPHTVTDDSFFCTMRSGSGKPPYKKIKPPADPQYPWGKVIAIVLRQPLLAERLGLIRPLKVPVPPDFFKLGGWIYVTLAPASDVFGLTTIPGALRLYASRVPVMTAARPLFSPVLFPVAATPLPGPYDEHFQEAEDYNDGFAKAVHATQPVFLDPLNERDDGSRPAKDVGIRLGWDDEQVSIWLNRQIDPAAAPLDAPMGVFGYRIDARVQGTATWSSLCRATSAVTVGNTSVGKFDGELAIETHPIQPDGDRVGVYWLPSYFTNWTGPSLVARDRLQRKLIGDPKADAPSPVIGVDPSVLLRYGTTYELRVRLMDHTGGGPAVEGVPQVPGPSPVFPLPFRRWIRPHAVRVVTKLPNVSDTANAPNKIEVARPHLGYPEYVFTGAPNAAADLLADVPAAQAEGREVGLADPDVSSLRIAVEVLALGLDTGPGGGADAGYHKLFETTRAFPANTGTPLQIDLDWRDVGNADALGPPPASGAVPVPTARDVRLVFTAVAKDDPQLGYFGADDVRFGPSVSAYVRKQSLDERNLLLAETPGDLLRGIFLEPDDLVDAARAFAQKAAGKTVEAPANAIGRLAGALGLAVNGLTLHARTGRRMVFGASAGLRHVLAPDNSGITMASNADLSRHWIVAIRATLNRDWTWDGLAATGFSVIREGVGEVGRIEPRRTVNHDALTHPERESTDLIFLDVVDPKPAAGAFPSELALQYRLQAQFASPPAQSDAPITVEVSLPITTPPNQVPRVTSARLALSPYVRSSDYSRTGLRRRVLWFEFAAPIQNPRDAYFARMVAYAPDPVMLGAPIDSRDDPEPPLPIDPEPIRTIIPGQSDDRAGLDAMQRLIPSDSPLHFMLSLPSGLAEDSPELFGFFTYEFRVGHSGGWSTAQGRFGAPLRVTGVQHPCPPLPLATFQDENGLQASAAFAVAVADGRSVGPVPPATQLFVFLYAQVVEGDHSDRRNVLLDQRPAVVLQKPPFPAGLADLLYGTASWTNDEIRQLLAGLTLDAGTPLSCLAAETMPGGRTLPDPLGASLGQQRILRTSPLVPVTATCVIT